MADATSLPDLQFLRFDTESIPKITLAEPSAAGSSSLVFASDIEDQDGNAPTKAMFLGAEVNGKFMVMYIAAGGFADKRNVTITTRQCERGGLDFATADTANDFDLPSGTEIFSVVAAFHPRLINEALQGRITSLIKFGSRPLYDNGAASNAPLAAPIYADATARDAAITVPQNGDIVYNTAQGVVQKYEGGAWVNSGTATTVNATESAAGKVELATQAELDAGTDTGGTDATVVPRPSIIAVNNQNQKHTFAADAEASDSYAITLTPAPTAYATGQKFTFTANTANTGACTLNVNALGAKAIKKLHDQDLEDNDIESGSVVEVVYDGTNFQIQSPSATNISAASAAALTGGISSPINTQHAHSRKNGATTKSVAATSDSLVIAHGLGVAPNWTEIEARFVDTGNQGFSDHLSIGEKNGSTYSCVYAGGYYSGAAGDNRISNISTTRIIYIPFIDGSSTKYIEATLAVDSTNLTLSLLNGSSSAQNISVKWKTGV